MLPNLPQLCPIARDELQTYRDEKRLGFESGTSWFLDLVDGSTGELIGVSGLREINSGVGSAEWGVAVATPYQRRGICAESFEASAREAAHRGCTTITATTLPTNEGMLQFLINRGFEMRAGDFEISSTGLVVGRESFDGRQGLGASRRSKSGLVTPSEPVLDEDSDDEIDLDNLSPTAAAPATPDSSEPTWITFQLVLQ